VLAVLTSATAAASSPAAADAPQELQQQQPAASTSAAAADAPPTPAPPAFTAVKQLRLRSAAAYLPHPDKESYGGEDAHFVSNLAGGALGVADGACCCGGARLCVRVLARLAREALHLALLCCC
jgi:hypothetical protein